MKQRLPAIIWTDDEDAALPVRQQYRSEGHSCVIRRASMFATADVEDCSRLIFLNAASRDIIIAAYRQDEVRARIGEVPVIDIPVDQYRKAESIPEFPKLPSSAPSAEDGGGDALDAAIADMSDEDLRTYCLAITGKKPHHKAGRDTIVKQIRAHQAGAPPPEEPQGPQSDAGRIQSEQDPEHAEVRFD